MQIRTIMSDHPVHLTEDASAVDAARLMAQRDIGTVLVTADDGEIVGLITDRDIALRCVAEGDGNPHEVSLGSICTRGLSTLAPEQEVEDALRKMRTQRVRRLPVVEDGVPVGVLSLGDLAVARDPGSVLGQISAARPNN